ncbi:MAG: kelch repeat-containing protein [Bacteroidota bacterium]
MKKASIFSLLLLALLACREEDFQPLSFFEVMTTDYDDLLETVALSASINNGGQELELTYGFLYSPTNSELSFENTNDVEQTSAASKRFATNTEETITINTNAVVVGQPYFYRAYVRSGDRVLLGEVRTFVAGQEVGIGIADTVSINNNTARLEGFVAGLLKNYGQSASNHGYVYAPTAINSDPLLDATGVRDTMLGELAGDRIFAATVADLQFNTSYTAKAFIQLANDLTIYSDPVVFEVRDGWRLSANLTLEEGLRDAIAMVANGKAYLGIGCPLLCDDVTRIAGNDLFEFDPAQGQTEELSPFNSAEIPGGRLGGFTFKLRDTLYFGGGVFSFSGFLFAPGDLYYFFPENETSPWLPAGASPFYPALARSNAITFTIDDRVFYGLGEDEFGEELSDFYEFDPSKLSGFDSPWIPRDSLRLSIDASCENIVQQGRKEAVAFALNGKGYVLTGFANNSTPVADFWEFDPNVNDGTGQWNCLGLFPGGIRTGASAFVVNGKAYVTGGETFDNTYYNDLWEFDGTTWTRKQDFVGTPRKDAVAFALNGKGYLATGSYEFGTSTGVVDLLLSDIWEYTPAD